MSKPLSLETLIEIENRLDLKTRKRLARELAALRAGQVKVSDKVDLAYDNSRLRQADMVSRLIETYADLVGFVALHGKPVQESQTNNRFEQCEEPLAIDQYAQGMYKATFADGWRLHIVSDYEPGYSELTPGEGWTLEIKAFEPDEA